MRGIPRAREFRQNRTKHSKCNFGLSYVNKCLPTAIFVQGKAWEQERNAQSPVHAILNFLWKIHCLLPSWWAVALYGNPLLKTKPFTFKKLSSCVCASALWNKQKCWKIDIGNGRYDNAIISMEMFPFNTYRILRNKRPGRSWNWEMNSSFYPPNKRPLWTKNHFSSKLLSIVYMLCPLIIYLKVL